MADGVTGKRHARHDLKAEEDFLVQLSMMRRAFMASPLRNVLLWLCAGILAVIVATAFGQILLNRWNQPFYDSLERRDLQAFFHQLLIFAEIAGGLLVLNVAQSWLNQMLHLKLREGLTRDLITEWMRPRRAFRLANAGAIGVNPDQRLHEDARHLADLSADLGIELVQASILLVSFVGVLWALSSGFVFHVGGRDLAIPGYMVWAAVIYAGTASVLSWLAGRPLIRLNSERYAREAELRFSLMRVNEHVDAISLAAGEADERRRLDLDLATVLQAVRRIIVASVRLTWVTAGYGWMTVVAPIVIASPVYFAGDLTFGGLMMAVGAFNQVHASLRWFVSNIGSIADWRATLLRVASFRSALLKVDDLHDVEKQIEFADAEAGHLTFDNIEVAVAGRMHETFRNACGYWAGRARAGDRRTGRRQDAVLPGNRRPLALGQRTGRTAGRRGGDLHSEHALLSARIAAGSAVLIRLVLRLSLMPISSLPSPRPGLGVSPACSTAMRAGTAN